MDIAFGSARRECIEFLRFSRCSERGEGENLSFAASEKARSMGAWADIHCTPNWADFSEASAIRTEAALEDPLAHDSF